MSDLPDQPIISDNNKTQTFRFEFYAIGTKWIIDLDCNLSKTAIDKIFLETRNRIEIFEDTYSRFREKSIISKIAESAGIYKLPEDAKKMINLCQQLYKLTDGFFTPLIGKTLVETGYDTTYSLKPKQTTFVSNWEDVIEYDHPNLIIKKPTQLDFGAIGKGYIIDIISDLLRLNNINNFCIDAGGDISYHNQNKKSLRVGLENPNDTSQVIGVASIINKSICASAGSRRRWAKYHHIINPKTLTSPENILAVWVIANETILADGLTTCLFFVEPEKLLAAFDFDYLILKSDFSISKSSGFNAELFIK